MINMTFDTKWTNPEVEKLYHEMQGMYQQCEYGPVKQEILASLVKLYVCFTVPVVIVIGNPPA